MSINYKINLRTRTKVCGFTDLSYFFMDLHLLIELYPLVPFPPSVDERVSAVTAEPLRWRTVTPARTTEVKNSVESLFRVYTQVCAPKMVSLLVKSANLFGRFLTDSGV